MKGASPRQDLGPRLNQPRPDVVLPHRYGSYLLVEVLASSTTADVFEAIATDRRLFGRTVAVKCLVPALSWSTAFARKFADQAAIAAALDHPSIVRVLDYGLAEGRLFVVTEHLDGRDLARTLRALGRSRLTLNVGPVAQIGLRIARGLQHAHGLCDPQGNAYGLVHRNVNPG